MTGWQGLAPRYLVALQAIAEERSFARAAERLGYTQSAVSQQLAALERIVGRRLVERSCGRREVALTDPGERLLAHGRAILARIESARAELERAAGAAATLRVATFQSVAARIIPAVVSEFARRRPDVQLVLSEGTCPLPFLSQLERGELDLAFVELPLPSPRLEAVEVLRDPWDLVVPAGSGIHALDGRPLLGFSDSRELDAFLRARGAGLGQVLRSNDNATLQGLVAEGAGVAVLPRLAIDRADPRTEVVPLADAPAPRRLGVAWSTDRERSAAAVAFVAAVVAVCAEPARSG